MAYPEYFRRKSEGIYQYKIVGYEGTNMANELCQSCTLFPRICTPQSDGTGTINIQALRGEKGSSILSNALFDESNSLLCGMGAEIQDKV